ncbi:MAG TPA: Flp pilus assembly protein CpaB [Actinomycetota bacterium]
MSLLRRRPPTSAILLFAFAVVLSLSAAILMGTYAQRLRSTRPDVGPPASVVVAAGPLTRGTILDADDVAAANIPSSLVPPGSLTELEGATGRVLVADIAEGEIVTRSRVASTGAGPLSSLVPVGLRAFSLPVSVAPGSLAPGDLIDVIATFGANGGRPYTDTVASGVQVMRMSATQGAGIGATTSSGASGGTIIVLTDPTTVEALARAAATGIVSIAVIGPEPEPFGVTAGLSSPVPTPASSSASP